MFPTTVRIGVAAGCLLLAAPAIGRAQQSTPGAHVDVSATPAMVLPGQPVTIFGSTGTYQNKNQANITVRHESGTLSAPLSAPVASNGTFSLTFSDTKKPGKYKVTVTAPDGKGKGEAEFRVGSIGTIAADVERIATELGKRIDRLISVTKASAVSLPPSDERDVVIKKIDDIQAKRKTITLPPVVILGELKKIVPGPGVVNLPDQKIFGELRDWVPEGERAIDEIDKSGIAEKPAPVCETINTALQGAKFASYAFAITGKLNTTLINIGVDKGTPALVNAIIGQGTAASGVSSGLKMGAELAKKESTIFNALIGLSTDLVELLVKKVFERYCSQYTGPMNAKMTMVWKEGVQRWLQYGVELEGVFRLRYPKDPPAGKPVYMTGEFEGNATNFTFWEDVTVVEQLPKSLIVVARQWLSPQPFPNSVKSPVDFGQIARKLTLAYFDVPVVAEMTGETIKMQVKPARSDFSDAVKNRLLFVVLAGLIPDFKVFSFPIEKAQWILWKAFDDPAILPITKTGADTRAIKITKQMHRDSPDKSVNVDFMIKVDAAGEVEKPKK
jgi:hypothetical protein